MDIIASNWRRNSKYQSFRHPDLHLFYGDIDDNGTVDSVYYYTGAIPGGTTNLLIPRHKAIYRKINTGPPILMNLGITRFNLTYYDSAGAKTLLAGKVRALRVSLDVEGSLQSVSAGGRDTVYNTIHWQQYIVPKALFAWLDDK